MTDTDRLGLPLIDAAQAQKHVTHNAALERIDALMHLGVVTRTSAPPATVPADARYLVAGTPAGCLTGCTSDRAPRLRRPPCQAAAASQCQRPWTGPWGTRSHVVIRPGPGPGPARPEFLSPVAETGTPWDPA